MSMKHLPGRFDYFYAIKTLKHRNLLPLFDMYQEGSFIPDVPLSVNIIWEFEHSICFTDFLSMPDKPNT